MMLIQLKRNSGLAAALYAARRAAAVQDHCTMLPECRFLHCQCHSHHQPLTYTRNSSIDLLKLEGAAIKHNNRKEMLRIENRSDQKQRTCSAAAAAAAAAAGGVKLHCVSRKIILNKYLQ